MQGSERNKKWRFKIAGFCAESGLQMYFVWPAWCFLKVWINGKYFTVKKFCTKMQVSNLWKIGISDYGEPAPHKQPLAELSDWIFLDLAPVCHSSHHSLFSLHADLLSLCMHCCFCLCLVWSHEFASLTRAVLPRETLPGTLCNL